MSIVTNPSITISSITPKTEETTVLSADQKFLEAFEKLDKEQILNALKEGANPFQEVPYTKEFVKGFLNGMFIENPKAFIYSVDKDYLSTLTDNENFIQEVLNVKAEILSEAFDGGKKPDNEQVLKLATEILILSENSKIDDGFAINQTPIQIAAAIRDIELTKALIEAGVDVSNPTCFDLDDDKKIITLKGILKNLELYNENVPYNEFNDITLSKAERITKMLDYLGIKESNVRFSFPTFFSIEQVPLLSESDIEFIELLAQNDMPIYDLIDMSNIFMKDNQTLKEIDLSNLGPIAQEKISNLLSKN